MLKYPKLGKGGIKSVLSPYSSLFRKTQKEQLKEIPALPTKNTTKDGGEIRIQGLHKTFGKNEVLKNINLKIPPGKLFGIIGINGTGKTTLLKHIIGFYKPTKGVITFRGKDIKLNSKTIKKRFGFASQNDSFYGDLNVEENIKYFGELYGLTKDFIDAHTHNILKTVNLYDARKTLAKNLSTGMQRRLDIACALIHDPAVLILDEPTEDLDPALRREVINLIKKINENGTTIIMTSHLLWEVEATCDYVAIIAEGTILEYGTPDEIRDAYTKNEEIRLETLSANYTFIKKIPGIKKIIKKGNKIILYTPKATKIAKKIIPILERKKEKILHMEIRRPSLNEVFEHLTGKDVWKK